MVASPGSATAGSLLKDNDGRKGPPVRSLSRGRCLRLNPTGLPEVAPGGAVLRHLLGGLHCSRGQHGTNHGEAASWDNTGGISDLVYGGPEYRTHVTRFTRRSSTTPELDRELGYREREARPSSPSHLVLVKRTAGPRRPWETVRLTYRLLNEGHLASRSGEVTPDVDLGPLHIRTFDGAMLRDSSFFSASEFAIWFGLRRYGLRDAPTMLDTVSAEDVAQLKRDTAEWLLQVLTRADAAPGAAMAEIRATLGAEGLESVFHRVEERPVHPHRGPDQLPAAPHFAGHASIDPSAQIPLQ